MHPNALCQRFSSVGGVLLKTPASTSVVGCILKQLLNTEQLACFCLEKRTQSGDRRPRATGRCGSSGFVKL